MRFRVLLMIWAVATLARGSELSNPQQIAQTGLQQLGALKVDTPAWWAAVEQLQTDLEPSGLEGLLALASYYQDSSVRSCTVSFALGFVGRQHPQETLNYMMTALPLPERSDDMCVMGGMTLLGPAAFPSLIDCGTNGPLSSAWVCLNALVAQASQLPDAIDAMGLRDGGGIRNPPSSRSGIRKVTKRFAAWWADHESEVTWSVKTQRLTRETVAK